MVVEINVGREELRVISLPDSIINNDDISATTFNYGSLMEVDDHLVLLAKKRHAEDYTIWVKKKGINTSTKVFILYNDDQDKRKNKRKRDACNNGLSTGGDRSDHYWMEDNFLMPVFEQERERLDFVAPIPGTNLLIIKLSHPCSYYYNWKN